MVFDIENLNWKSHLGAFWQSRKAIVKVSGDTNLLNEWVSEGVAFDPHDFTARLG